MTVAAVVLAASASSALADAAGRPSVRRIAETAWAGGAMPIVVVADDPDGAVGSALAGSEATLVAPAAQELGPVGQMVRGIGAALDLVSGTDAALVWPARLTWVDPETVTMLLQAHGLDPVVCLRPRWDDVDGWPVLVPLTQLDALAAISAHRMPDEIIADLVAGGVPLRTLDLGDPGAVIDRGVVLDEVPAYTGPAHPVDTPPDWGAAAAEAMDDGPTSDTRRMEPAGGG